MLENVFLAFLQVLLGEKNMRKSFNVSWLGAKKTIVYANKKKWMLVP